MRKYTWLVALALVFCMLRPAMSAPMFPDVPDMWAKDAVAALAAKGILEGYPDGTFKGDRAATRYEVAMIVARLLAKMEQEHATFATKADLDELRKLVNQLREELDALGVRVQNLEDNVAKLDKRVTELERITFYGSLDARFVSMRMNNTGLSTGINGSATGGLGGTSAAIPIPGTTLIPGATFNPAVGIPMIFVNTGSFSAGNPGGLNAAGINPLTGATAAQAGRPLVIRELPWNTSNFNTATAATGLRPNYNIVAGSTRSLGGNNPVAAGGLAIGGGSLFDGLTGRVGVMYSTPAVLPTFEVRTGRPWTNGVGSSGQGILGVRIKLNEDMDAGAEFAAYYSTGDSIVDQFYGVSPSRLSNPFAGVQGLGPSGGAAAGFTGQNLDNTPQTRMNIDNFWFVHKPTGIKVQLGSYGDSNMDSIVYTPEYNPNVWGPRYLDNYGFRVSGSTHLLAKLDWEVFGSNVGDGNRVAPEALALGAAPYKPYLWGIDLKWTFGQEGNSGFFKGNVFRIWDDPAGGQGQAVGLISNVNGVWTDWVNPNGFYAAQINRGGTADVPNAQRLAGIGSTSDVRPIIPTSASVSGNVPGVFGQDQAVGIFGNITGPINPAVIASTNGQSSTFGPQSMFTWGISAGWNYTWNDDVKLRINGEYSQSDYKPSANSSYKSPDGNAWRVALGATLFKDFDVDGEYVNVDPYHNPYVLQYPNVGGVTYNYVRIPSLSWFPEMYPVNDKDVYPNNREGFRVFVKWNPTDPKDGKRKTVFWGEYGSLDQQTSSLQQVRFSPGSIAVGDPGVVSTAVPNGFVLGQNPGFVDVVFAGFHPTSFAGFTGNTTPSSVNQFATPLENPKGRVTNWGAGINYRFDQLNGLALHAGYKNYQFRRASSLAPSVGGSENNVNLDLSGGLVGLQYPVNERFAVKGGYAWTDIKGHLDPVGTYRNFALDTGSTGFNTFNNSQTAPFVGFDYDIARNVTWNMTAKFLDSKDRLGTFNSPNFFLQRNPFSWNGTQVTSQVKVTF